MPGSAIAPHIYAGPGIQIDPDGRISVVGGGGDVTGVTGSLGIVVTFGGGPVPNVAFPLATQEGQILEWDAGLGQFVVSGAAGPPAVGDVLVWSGATWLPQAPPGGDVTGVTGTTGIVVTNPGGPVPNVALPSATQEGQILEWDAASVAYVASGAAAPPAPGDVLSWSGATWLPVAPPGGDVTGITGSRGVVVTNPGGPVPDVALPLATVDGQLLVWDQPTLTWVVSDAVAPVIGNVATWNGANWTPFENLLTFSQPGDAEIAHANAGDRIFSLDKWTFGRSTPVQTDQQVSIDAPDRFGLSVTGPHADAGASIQMQTHTAGVVNTEWEWMATGAGASQGAGKLNTRWIPLGVLGDHMTIVGTTGFVGLGNNTSPGERLDVLGNTRSTEFRGPVATDLILRCAAGREITLFDDADEIVGLSRNGTQAVWAAPAAVTNWFFDGGSGAAGLNWILRSGTAGGGFVDVNTFNIRDQPGTSSRLVWTTGAAMTETTGAGVTSYTYGTAPLTLNSSVTILGNTTLGDATSDTWSTVARLASTIDPSTDNNFDLGSTARRMSNVHGRLLNARADATDTLKAVLSATALTQTAGNSFQISARDTQVVGQGRQTRVVAADGATVTFNFDLGNFQEVTLGGDRIIAFSNLRDGGGPIILELVQDGTGNRSVTWPATAVFAMGNGADPPLSTVAGSRDRFIGWSDGTNLYFFSAAIADGTAQVVTLPFNTGSAGVVGGTTRYLTWGTVAAAEANAQFPVSRFTRVRRLRVEPTTNTLNGTCVITIRKEGVATALTVTVPAGSTAVQTLLTGFSEFSEGDNLSIEAVANGLLGTINFNGSIEMAPG